MKTMKTKNTLWMTLSITAVLMTTACSIADNNIAETPAVPQATKIIPYTVTVGDAGTTRATLDDDWQRLNFADGDKLYITGTDIKGVLDITDGAGSASGATFSGNLTYTGEGTPADDLSLSATLVSAQQTVGSEVSVDGNGAVTVNYPTAAYCADVYEAVKKYSHLTGTSTFGAKTLSLTQQTAFLNFYIYFKEGTTPGTKLTAVVSNNGSAICTANITTKGTNKNVSATFVLPVASSTTLNDATVKMDDKETISFGSNGKKLKGKIYNVYKNQVAPIDLATVTEDLTASDGDILTGTLGTMVKISIADGATVKLRNVDINGSGEWNWVDDDYYDDYDGCAAINCEGNGTIVLEGSNTIKSFCWKYSGIHAPYGSTLTIQGAGSLTASGGSDGAGIGCGYQIGCGNIVINSGNITANGGEYAAGIGSAYNASCGDITINGGTVTAKSERLGAGIGSGNGNLSSCGNITISGGTIIATGGEQGAGIGSGASDAQCGDITITSGVTSVTATKGYEAQESIGVGSGSSKIKVSIEDESKVTQK
jgi:hypothetical protein